METSSEHQQECIQLVVTREVGFAVQQLMDFGLCPCSIAIGLHSAAQLLWPDGPYDFHEIFAGCFAEGRPGEVPGEGEDLYDPAEQEATA